MIPLEEIVLFVNSIVENSWQLRLKADVREVKLLLTSGWCMDSKLELGFVYLVEITIGEFLKLDIDLINSRDCFGSYSWIICVFDYCS